MTRSRYSSAQLQFVPKQPLSLIWETHTSTCDVTRKRLQHTNKPLILIKQTYCCGQIWVMGIIGCQESANAQRMLISAPSLSLKTNLKLTQRMYLSWAYQRYAMPCATKRSLRWSCFVERCS